MEHNKGALIAMSGGVDSSAAAYLALKAGYRCLGVTMRLCQDTTNTDDAAKAAERLGIPYEVLTYTSEFREQVIDKFIQVYEQGGTPNPCIDCNRRLKFGQLLQDAQTRGLDFVVTGHYAQIEYNEDTGRWLLKKAPDVGKDQSYFLYTLTQYQLAHTLFPLGGMEKRQVRELAGALGFQNAGKRDSQDICFVPDGDYASFMERTTGKTYPDGDFLNQNGQTVGRHRGAVRYTLGQRKGLGLSMGEPVYVCGKDMANNTVTIGPESALYTREVLVEELNWISIPELTKPLRVRAKTRSRQKEQWAEIQPTDAGQVRIIFDEPQRAVTPGQAAVFYDGDVAVGGGTIVSTQEERK